jgi:hypothetical protein
MINEYIYRADEWYIDHHEHIGRLVDEDRRGMQPSYEPSAEDAPRPELWKAAHWRWFLDNT